MLCNRSIDEAQALNASIWYLLCESLGSVFICSVFFFIFFIHVLDGLLLPCGAASGRFIVFMMGKCFNSFKTLATVGGLSAMGRTGVHLRNRQLTTFQLKAKSFYSDLHLSQAAANPLIDRSLPMHTSIPSTRCVSEAQR